VHLRIDRRFASCKGIGKSSDLFIGIEQRQEPVAVQLYSCAIERIGAKNEHRCYSKTSAWVPDVAIPMVFPIALQGMIVVLRRQRSVILNQELHNVLKLLHWIAAALGEPLPVLSELPCATASSYLALVLSCLFLRGHRTDPLVSRIELGSDAPGALQRE